MYCISCYRCPTILYIGEIGQSLRGPFGEHLRSIRNITTPGFPVAQHFNSTGHSVSDIRVRGRGVLHASHRALRANYIINSRPPAMSAFDNRRRESRKSSGGNILRYFEQEKQLRNKREENNFRNGGQSFTCLADMTPEITYIQQQILGLKREANSFHSKL